MRKVTMRTIGDIPRLGARRHGDKPALEMAGDTMSYAELDEGVNRTSTAMQAHGVGEGDRVCLMAENCLEFAEVLFATAKAGAVFVPLNFRYGPKELGYVLSDVAPTLVFAGPGYEAAMAKTIESTGHVVPLVVLDDGYAASSSIEVVTLAELRASGRNEEPRVVVDPDGWATILYTSGTTGNPKGVIATHAATMRLLPVYGVEGDLCGADRMLICMPLFHGGGLVIQLLPSLMLGATVVLAGKGFAPAGVVEIVRAHRVTITLWSPTMLALLVNESYTEPPRTESLNKIWYGSSSILPAVLDKSRELFPSARFYQWYGTTEATSVGILRPDDHAERALCTGRELFTAETKVVDEDGHEVPAGEVGELVVATGMTTMVGYLGKAEETATTIRDGWLHTGDLATRDEQGFFTIVGRAGDLIISGGENVYPLEVEAVLTQHPAIREAAVIGLPDETYGEVVAAVVVGDRSITTTDVRDYVGARIARYKCPRVVHIVDELPRNASGKVVRRDLASLISAAYQES